jgi:hypothetical protein
MSDNWGFYRTKWGKKILAKKFEIGATTIFDFNIYRLEQMIDDSWNGDGTDAYILAEILEAYLHQDIGIDWAEGFPMAFPLVDYYDDF